MKNNLSFLEYYKYSSLTRALLYSIRVYSSVSELIDNENIESIKNIDDNLYNSLNHIDDFESLHYIVFNGNLVITTDSLTGNIISEPESIESFIQNTINYIKEME